MKDILSYGDKVESQSDPKKIQSDNDKTGSSFGELAIEVNKLEEIDEASSVQSVKPKKKKHEHIE